MRAVLLVALPAVTIALMVAALVDLAMIERHRVRGLPRWAWIPVIVILVVIGPVLWFLVGHARQGSSGDPARRPLAPDDDPAFLGSLGRDREQEERIRRLEQELAELDDDDPKN